MLVRKNIVVILACIMLFTATATHASLLDNAVAGTFISNKGKVQAGFILPLLSYRAINFDVGLIGDINSAQTMTGISWDIKKLAKELGVTYHLDENFAIGFYSQYQIGDRELCYGVYIGRRFN